MEKPVGEPPSTSHTEISHTDISLDFDTNLINNSHTNLTRNSPTESTRRDTSKPTVQPSLPGPFDHGWLPWIQVVGVFATWTNSWGLYTSFGEFQTFYQDELLADKSPEQIGWIGSLQAFLLLFLGTLGGILYDRGYLRLLLVAGNGFVVFGMLMTSFCTQYWQLILAQGIVVGIGFGLLFIPCTALIPQWFIKRKALATGLAASGSGFGGLIYAIIFRNLLHQVGFAWTTRIMAFLALLIAVLMLVIIRSKVKSAPQTREVVQWRAFTEPAYWVYGVALCAVFLGIYTPWIFAGQYAVERGIDATISSYLVVFINAGSFVGRIGLSFIADRIGVMNTAILLLAASGLLALCWMAISSTAGMIVFAILYGAFAGSFLGMCALVVVPLTRDMRTLGTRIGQLCMVSALTVLVGIPINGAFLASSIGFLGLQVFTGVALLVGAAGVLASRTAVVGAVTWKKI